MAAKTLYQKLLEVQKGLRGLAKDSSGNGYQYVSGAKVLGALRLAMDKHGLLLMQEVTEMTNTPHAYMVGKGDGAREKVEVLTECRFRFTWIDVDSGEKLECAFAANGFNGWDKGVGSAITYAERYFILKFFHIPTDEDDVDYYERPKMSDAQCRKACERIAGGDADLEAKIRDYYDLTEAQNNMILDAVEVAKTKN